ncbi:RNA-directed DNA polymerase [Lacticaseibacillus zhaodongensis]|uniref:RNA-directed DNA polymerase n=1 Tax=Lacticaseibacillus zhaodongensis TaxID=2668065 RepID=UPI0018AFEF07|nr:RNA-directed DNA polymerase [Lacticaseibacillus zhaodongensis]
MLTNFYDSILSWESLVRYGYMDYIPQWNSKPRQNVDPEYGRTDVFYSKYFNLNNLLDQFGIEKLNKLDFPSKVDTEPINFTIPKSGEVRRTLKFPNIYSYIALSQSLISNKTNITQALELDTSSTSNFFNRKPFDFAKTERIRDGILFGKTRFLKTDFSSFYHTLYTHAIPWIIHGKSNAKMDRGNLGQIGNLFDRLVENEQYGETHGLPTGSLATRVVVEFTMSYFDRQLQAMLPKDVTFHRYVDDFIFAYNKPDSELAVMKDLRYLAGEYGFIINENKVAEVPFSSIEVYNPVLNYLDKNAPQRLTVKSICAFLNAFIKLGITAEADGAKGSEKLIFTSIGYWFKSIKDQQVKMKTVQAFVDRDSNYGEVAIIDKLLSLVIIDSRLGVPYLKLLDELDSFLDKSNNLTIQKHFDNLWREQSEKIYSIIYDAQIDNENQTVYALLMIFRKTGWKLSEKFVDNFMRNINCERVEVDDFSLLLVIQQAIRMGYSKMDELVSSLNELFLNTQMDQRDPLAFKHWLVRYELLRINHEQAPSNSAYNKAVNVFNNSHKGKDGWHKPLSFAIFKNDVALKTKKDKDSKTKSEEIVPQYPVSNFYYKLIESSVSFARFDD